MIEIRMPKPGDAITEAELIRLHVADGDRVDEGDPLYQIATEKVEMDIEAPAAGVVAWKVKAGNTYDVGDLLAVIDDQ